MEVPGSTWECRGDLVGRLIRGISRVTTGVIGLTYLLSPRVPPSSNGVMTLSASSTSYVRAVRWLK